MNELILYFDVPGNTKRSTLPVCELLVPLINGGTERERIDRYGQRAACYRLSEDIDRADICVLPFSWNYYSEHRLTGLAEKAATQTANAGKRLLIFSGGDFTASVPFDNAIIVQRCAYQSRQGLRGQTLLVEPAFIEDYLKKYCEGELQFRRKQEKPVVGFCGQAGGTWLDFERRRAVNLYRKFSYQLGWAKWEPAPFEHTLFRKQVLSSIQSSSKIETNYLIRSRYRAGYWKPNKDPFHPTRMEFIQNILDSDYTVCMRGGGNFSVRLYETLALGRIPIFINTDCILPFDQEIDYRKYFVWVEPSELKYIGEKIADFHNSMSDDDFIQRQMDCRQLWLKYHSLQGYYGQLSRYLKKILSISSMVDA